MNVGDAIGAGWTVTRVLGGPGQSGMGIIYVVDGDETHQPMAFKTIQDELYVDNPSAVERFTREAYLWINLGQHPNVTRADFVTTHKRLTGQSLGGSKPYIGLEYVSGGDLASWIGTPRLKDVSEILRLAIEFCDGMMHALSNGISAHRDIKPANCLMTEDGTLKVTDFGLVKAFAELAGGASRLMALGGGTAPYMAPEQFHDFDNVDVRADIYSFGIMLYEMVTGEWPFAGRTWEEFERAHDRTAPPRVTRLAEIDDIVQICLQKDPAPGFSNFSELRKRLARAYETTAGKPAPRPVAGEELGVAHWCNRGFSLHNLGMYEEALLSFERALGPPDDPTFTISGAVRGAVLLGKGETLRALNRLDEALAAFDLGLQANPVPDAWLNRANVLRMSGRTDEALASCDAALRLNAGYHRSWSLKGDAFFSIERYQDALTSYSRAIELLPGYGEHWKKLGSTYLRLSRFDDALNAFGRVIELDPGNTFAWVSKAVMLVHKKQPDEALQCCDQALSLEADDVAAHGTKGWILSLLNRHAEALPYLERAAADGDEMARDLLEECRQTLKVPDTMERLLNESRALMVSDPAAAYQKLTELAAINPQSFCAWYFRGNILSRAKRFADALPMYQRAAEIMPASFDVWCELGEAHHDLQQWDEAIVNFQRALEIDHSSLRAHGQLGNALLFLGRNEEALTEFGWILREQPDHAVALFNKASALLALKRYAEALSAVDRALAGDAADTESWLLRARILAGMNRFPEALALLGQIESATPRSARLESLVRQFLQQWEAAPGKPV